MYLTDLKIKRLQFLELTKIYVSYLLFQTSWNTITNKQTE